MVDIAVVLARWELASRQVRERMYRAPTLWHAFCLLAQGGRNNVVELLERHVNTHKEPELAIRPLR